MLYYYQFFRNIYICNYVWDSEMDGWIKLNICLFITNLRCFDFFVVRLLLTSYNLPTDKELYNLYREIRIVNIRKTLHDNVF